MRKNILHIIILLLISTTLNAQFDTKSELGYLIRINKQNNKQLIKQNLFHAEQHADRIIAKNMSNTQAKEYFTQLAISYALIHNYAMSQYYYTLQDIVFTVKAKPDITGAFEKSLLQSKTYNSYTTFISGIHKSEQAIADRMILWSTYQIKIVNNKTYNTLKKHIQLIIEKENTDAFSKWILFTKAGVNACQLRKTFSTAKNGTHLGFNIQNQLSRIVYKKIIKYYRRTNKMTLSNQYLTEFKSGHKKIIDKICYIFI